MKILINFGTLKIGGGQNVGLNFISGLLASEYEHEFHYVVAENSAIGKKVIEMTKDRCIIVHQNPILRIFQEKTIVMNYIIRNNIDIVYTVFGYGCFGRVIQVSGIADSNLFYPEIDFWCEYSGYKKAIKKLIDSYRMHGYLHAKGLIFENANMMERYISVYERRNMVIYIKPSIAVQDKHVEMIDIKMKDRLLRDDGHIKGLFLCGWQHNKGIMKIPGITYTMKEYGMYFEPILTAPIDQSQLHKEFVSECERYGVLDNVSIIGQVNKKSLPALYESVDFVFLLSKLESFSNNILEAWYYKKPLVISDYDWARSICGEAAIYSKQRIV